MLITGVTGFVGSHLAEELVEKGYKVYGTVRYTSHRDLKPIQTILDEIALVNGDITSFMSMKNVMRSIDPDYVFHLAALSPVRYSFDNPFQYELTNYQGTMNVIHALLGLPGHSKRRLLIASTAEVYGLQEEKPFKEDLHLRPTSPYAVSKAAADMYARMAARVYDLDCVILRPTNTFGRRFQAGFIVEYLVTSMLKGVTVYVGAPDSIRDYIYVSDHVNAYIVAMEMEKAKGQVFNVGSGCGISNRELASKISNIIDRDCKICFGTYPPGYPARPIVSDQPYLVLDSTKIRKELGWVTKVSLDEGLGTVVKYWREGGALLGFSQSLSEGYEWV